METGATVAAETNGGDLQKWTEPEKSPKFCTEILLQADAWATYVWATNSPAKYPL